MTVAITPALVPGLVARLFSDEEQATAVTLLAAHAGRANYPEVVRVPV